MPPSALDVSALVPALRARAVAAETARRVPDESIAELTAAGWFRALVPRSRGGDERDLREVMRGVVTLAQGCSATAWVASLFGIHDVLLAWFDEAVQAEVWAADPDVRVCSSIAPAGQVQRCAEGFRLDGRWSFVSGVDHASWVLLGGLAGPDEGTGAAARDPRAVYALFLVPLASCAIEDDWDVAGLQATGSKSVIVRDLVVPVERHLPLQRGTHPPTAGQRAHAAPLYRLPWFPLFRTSFPPVALGTALANLDAFRAYTSGRINIFGGRPARLGAGGAIRLAEAAAQVDAATALFDRDIEEMAEATDERPLAADAQARISYDCGFVIDACSHAINRLWRGSGGLALRRDNAMQRHFRDIYAMTQHGAFDMDVIGEAYGKELLMNPSFRLGARR